MIERDPLKIKPIPFVEFSWLWVTIGILVVLIGFAFMYLNTRDPHIKAALNFGIDYTGGDLITGIAGRDTTSKEVYDIVAKYSSAEPVVQVIKEGGASRNIEIRTRIKFDPSADEQTRNTQRAENLAKMKSELNLKLRAAGASDTAVGFDLKEQNYVGPTVGKELVQRAVIALIIGSILILIYIIIRFGNFLFAISAVLALLHDVVVTVGGAAILKVEVNQAFIAVVLTIIGYSINDTVVIYDRIRENMRKYPTLDFKYLCDLSLTQTLTRSVNTILTVVIMLVGLIVFGGESIQDFSRAMLIGIISGGYSSIFIATPLIILFRKKELARVATTVAAAEQQTRFPEKQSASSSGRIGRPKPATAPATEAIEATEGDYSEEEADEATDAAGITREDAGEKKKRAQKKGKQRRR